MKVFRVEFGTLDQPITILGVYSTKEDAMEKYRQYLPVKRNEIIRVIEMDQDGTNQRLINSLSLSDLNVPHSPEMCDLSRIENYVIKVDDAISIFGNFE